MIVISDNQIKKFTNKNVNSTDHMVQRGGKNPDRSPSEDEPYLWSQRDGARKLPKC